MAFSRSNLGRNWTDQSADVDTIDLTFSSPEPEQRPPQTTPQRAAYHTKKEPRSESSNVKRVKTEPSTVGQRSHGFQTHARPVDPAHLAELINTSNSHAVRSVLLDLCKLSPALSGAVARGLAPHSNFARGLIRQHQQQVPTRNVQRIEASDEDQTYERTRQRLLAERSARAPTLMQVRSPSTHLDAHRARPTGSQSVPKLKRERQPDLSDSESDLDQYIPREFPIDSRAAKPDRLPLRAASSSNSANRTPRPFSLTERLRSVQQKPAPRTESKTCIQCFKTVENEHETCFYHPSSMRNDAGVLTCEECDEPLAELGCAIGMHVTEP